MNPILYSCSNEDEIAVVVTPPLFSRARPPSSSSCSDHNNGTSNNRHYLLEPDTMGNYDDNDKRLSDVSSNKIFDSQSEVDPKGRFSFEWLESALEAAYSYSTSTTEEEKEESPISPSSSTSSDAILHDIESDQSQSRSSPLPDERDSPERVGNSSVTSFLVTSNFKFKGHRRVRSFSCDGRDESKHIQRLFSPEEEKASSAPLLPLPDFLSSPPSSTSLSNKQLHQQDQQFRTPPLKTQRMKKKKKQTPLPPPLSSSSRTPPLPNKHLLPKPMHRVQSDSRPSKKKKKKTCVKKLYEQTAHALQELDHVKALHLSEKILRKEERRNGYHHASVATALHNVAMVHLHARRYDEAESVLYEAIVLRKQTLGPYHKDVAASCIKLGHVLTRLKKHDDAIKAFKDALHISRDHHDDHQVQSAQILCHIGCLYYDAKELMAAQATFSEALSLYRQQDEPKSVSETLCNVGSIQLKRKNFKDAINSFSEALHLQRRIWGDNNSRVIATLDNLGYANSKNKDYAEALTYYKELLRSQLKYYGKFSRACSETVKKQNLMTDKLHQKQSPPVGSSPAAVSL